MKGAYLRVGGLLFFTFLAGASVDRLLLDPTLFAWLSFGLAVVGACVLTTLLLARIFAEPTYQLLLGRLRYQVRDADEPSPHDRMFGKKVKRMTDAQVVSCALARLALYPELYANAELVADLAERRIREIDWALGVSWAAPSTAEDSDLVSWQSAELSWMDRIYAAILGRDIEESRVGPTPDVTPTWKRVRGDESERPAMLLRASRVLNADGGEISLTFSEGTHGRGWYAYFTEYPEEGSTRVG